MLTASYAVSFPDLDWRALVTACGTEFVSLSSSSRGLVLRVRGTFDAIQTLTADLDFGPFDVRAA